MITFLFISLTFDNRRRRLTSNEALRLILVQQVLYHPFFILFTQHCDVVQCQLKVVIVPINDLLQVKHNYNTHHTVTIEDVRQTAVSV